jgi:hypothetical protein
MAILGGNEGREIGGWEGGEWDGDLLWASLRRSP